MFVFNIQSKPLSVRSDGTKLFYEIIFVIIEAIFYLILCKLKQSEGVSNRHFNFNADETNKRENCERSKNKKTVQNITSNPVWLALVVVKIIKCK